MGSEPQGSHLASAEPKPSAYTSNLTLGSPKGGKVGCKAENVQLEMKPSQSGDGGGTSCRAPPHHRPPCPCSLHTTPEVARQSWMVRTRLLSEAFPALWVPYARATPTAPGMFDDHTTKFYTQWLSCSFLGVNFLFLTTLPDLLGTSPSYLHF